MAPVEGFGTGSLVYWSLGSPKGGQEKEQVVVVVAIVEMSPILVVIPALVWAWAWDRVVSSLGVTMDSAEA